MTYNYELFDRDPRTANLINDGQARLVPSEDKAQMEAMLRQELQSFVCEGQYARGMQRILDSFVENLGAKAQRAAWVSGFYGSGKSHLLKMLCHLWANTEFADGTRARDLAPDLTPDILAAFRELDTAGRKAGGGVFAVSGSMPEGSSESARLTVLGIIFRACGLPQSYHQARFCLFLKDKGYYDDVKAAVEAGGKIFTRELSDLYVSPLIRNALVKCDPDLGDAKEVRTLIREQFPQTKDIDTTEFISLAKEVLSQQGGGEVPLTAVVIDEVQHYVGTSEDRSKHITELTEALLKQMSNRVLVVAAGQNALSTDTPQFAWLRDRFTIPVELSDADVETVTRKVLLAKKPEAVECLREELARHSGEIERQLTNTRIAPSTKDQEFLVADYPILPVRRRFWEKALRSIDPTGSSSLLRTQLRITHEALSSVATSPVSHVIPGDFMFTQQQSALVQQDILPREISDKIVALNDGTEEGKLAARTCGLIFLIRRLPRESGIDAGIRANEEMLADLLVSDLEAGGTDLRKKLPETLAALVEQGTLLFDGSEYNLQTRESADWEEKYRQELKKIRQDLTTHLQIRKDRLRSAVQRHLKSVNLRQGLSKEPRSFELHFGQEPPPENEAKIHLWIRDGWESGPETVLAEARAAGDADSTLHLFLPKIDEDRLRESILSHKAAKSVLDFKGVTTSPEADEAKGVMANRAHSAERTLDSIIARVLESAKVYKGGGAEMHDLELVDKVQSALEDSATRLFPRFDVADHKGWSIAIDRARGGSDTPMEAVGHREATTQHRVCKEILAFVTTEKEGRHIRNHFKSPPYGWPQDAIDAALICLHAEGELLAQNDRTGQPVPPRHLDQGSVPKTKFRAEKVSITGMDRIALKGLIQSGGISVKPADDLNAKASEFIAHLITLATSAGGNAPLPAPPQTHHLEDLRRESGNTQLQKILEQKETLTSHLKDWQEKAALVQSRHPQWDRLQQLLTCAPPSEDLHSIRTSITAITESRLLLEPTDPSAPLIQQLAEKLRAAVSQKRETYRREFTAQRQRLESDATWQKLPEEKRQTFYSQSALPEPTDSPIGTEQELISQLQTAPLQHQDDRAAALASRVDGLLTQAARELQPQAKPIRLPSAIITNEAELDAWLTQTRETIATQLKESPVSLS